jgi:hypothetical protein
MIEQHDAAIKAFHGQGAVLDRHLEMQRRRHGPPQVPRRSVRLTVGRFLVGAGSRVMGVPIELPDRGPNLEPGMSVHRRAA